MGEYNKVVRQPAGHAKPGAAGGMVEAVIRAGVGIYLRHQQAKILKEAICAAQPVFTDMTGDVCSLNPRKIEPERNELDK